LPFTFAAVLTLDWLSSLPFITTGDGRRRTDTEPCAPRTPRPLLVASSPIRLRFAERAFSVFVRTDLLFATEVFFSRVCMMLIG
jgi:hypothetical protein